MTELWAHVDSHSVDIEGSFRAGFSDWDSKLTTRFCFVLKLKMVAGMCR